MKGPPSVRIRPKAPSGTNARFDHQSHDHKNSTLVSSQQVDGPNDARLLGLAERIENGDPTAPLELYNLFVRTFASYYARRLGIQEMDDKIQDSFILAISPIQRGRLRDPSRLIPFSATIARRLVAAHIKERIRERRQARESSGTHPRAHPQTPEELAISKEEACLVRQHLLELPDRDREILFRTYILEQPKQLVCDEMDLTFTQYRLYKSRAKARLRKSLVQSMNRAHLAVVVAKARDGYGNLP